MGFRFNFFCLLSLIAVDCAFTLFRSTSVDLVSPSSGLDQDVLDYVLIAAHGVTVLGQGVVCFFLFSGTIWFTAGLLGELFECGKFSIPFWFCRLIFVAMPWVHRRWIAALGNRAMEDRDYRFLYCADLLVAISSWCGLVYIAACLTDRRMYPPYHREHIDLPQVTTALPARDAAILASPIANPGRTSVTTSQQNLRRSDQKFIWQQQHTPHPNQPPFPNQQPQNQQQQQQFQTPTAGAGEEGNINSQQQQTFSPTEGNQQQGPRVPPLALDQQQQQQQQQPNLQNAQNTNSGGMMAFHE